MKDYGTDAEPVPGEGRDTLPAMDSGEKRLNELGYKQELKRDLNTFKMFAITLSTMTLFTGIVPYYSQALINAGPVGITWGWWIAVVFVTFIGLALSEICSSFPTAGSLYYWAANLAGPKYGPFASWMTGYLEFIGISIGVGGQAFAGCQVLQIIILITTGGANGGGYVVTTYQFLGMMIATIFLCALLNSCAVNLVALIDVFSAWWQIIGGIVLIVTLPCVAPTLQPTSYVFTHFEDNLDVTGLPNGGYAFLVALLMSQYSLYGFDAAAHLTEETKGADKTGPMAILGSIGFFSIFGYCLLLSLTYSIQDPARLSDADTVTGGAYPVAQILWDAFYFRYGSGTGGVIFLAMIYGSFFFGCLSNIMSAARVCYALSRDGGLPLSFLWRRLSSRRVPIFAVWLCALIGIIVVLPVLASNVVFFAVTGMSTVGWVGSYSVPIFFRIVNPEEAFTPGPFYMGRYIGTIGGKVVHVVALFWILYTCVIFQMPLSYPITVATFNYAPVGMLAVCIFFLSWWAIDARRWFKGPVRTIKAGPEEEEE